MHAARRRGTRTTNANAPTALNAAETRGYGATSLTRIFYGNILDSMLPRTCRRHYSPPFLFCAGHTMAWPCRTWPHAKTMVPGHLPLLTPTYTLPCLHALPMHCCTTHTACTHTFAPRAWAGTGPVAPCAARTPPLQRAYYAHLANLAALHLEKKTLLPALPHHHLHHTFPTYWRLPHTYPHTAVG